ncbi:hypothetical protein [Desulfofustis glycolicus]|uniref:DUF3558 domain-containing protein n=1 Tax=Desulfofustis glycolicus DSM 9705 TaxID=1121409 RepID=A0A1M5YKI7_9BACT|nr:hypothetical protein [Desulfofustis glycolicus]MCB2214766.1 hypothetical protein [Desulfobulbaceae bacterium]SHI12557.1 hypothetical protein SAMN02745124_04154 [Desulfofustis glycolicus DSM 9705]
MTTAIAQNVAASIPLRKIVGAAVISVHLLLGAAVNSAYAAGDHACDYLTRDEVAAVMGAPVGEVESHPANPMGQSVCYFDIPAGLKIRFAQLQMVRSDWAAKAGTNWDASSLFANNMSFLDGLQDASGIGETAYWGGSGLKLGAGLHVLDQDVYITVQATMGDEQSSLDTAKILARLVLEKAGHPQE